MPAEILTPREMGEVDRRAGMAGKHCRGDGGAGVSHEGGPVMGSAFDGAAVDLAHLARRQDLGRHSCSARGIDPA